MYSILNIKYILFGFYFVILTAFCIHWLVPDHNEDMEEKKMSLWTFCSLD